MIGKTIDVSKRKMIIRFHSLLRRRKYVLGQEINIDLEIEKKAEANGFGRSTAWRIIKEAKKEAL